MLKKHIFWIILIIFAACNPKSSSKAESTVSKPIQLNVAAYNVEVSRNASAEEIGNALKTYDLDIVCFSEAPGGNWTETVGNVLGMQHIVIGKYTTAGHDDKYKTIASKTPLYEHEEVLMADTLHTATRAKTKIDGREFVIYSVHFPFGWRDQAHIDETTGKITALVNYLKERQQKEISLVMGDFNFIPNLQNPEENATKDTSINYYKMFVDIGLDVSWKELGIDIRTKNTHNALDAADEGNGNVIDHIMYNPAKVKAIDGKIIEMEKPLSDHKAVWARLELK